MANDPVSSEVDVEDLREQVDLALVDPEMEARARLLDLSSDYEQIERRILIGLGVTGGGGGGVQARIYGGGGGGGDSPIQFVSFSGGNSFGTEGGGGGGCCDGGMLVVGSGTRNDDHEWRHPFVEPDPDPELSLYELLENDDIF